MQRWRRWDEGDAGTGAPVGPRAYGVRRGHFSLFGGGGNSPLAGSLRLGVGRAQHLAAGGRQLRQRDPRMRLGRLGRRFRMQHEILKPVGEVAAAVAAILFLLAVAVLAAGGASHTDMEMIVVAVPRPDFLKPALVALGLAA